MSCPVPEILKNRQCSSVESGIPERKALSRSNIQLLVLNAFELYKAKSKAMYAKRNTEYSTLRQAILSGDMRHINPFVDIN